MKNYFLWGFIFFSSFASAQNLVPNPSFEDSLVCSTPLNVLFVCKDKGCTSYLNLINWYNPTKGNPDYLTASSGDPNYSVPHNWSGYQFAHSGCAYIGLYTYGGAGFPHQRDYVGIKLLSPLNVGKKYKVAFYVSLADSSRWATNNLGIYFSKDSIYDFTTMDELNNIPQIISPKNAIISDTLNWTLINGTYTAAGGEDYIAIGNFYPDSLTKVDTVNTTGWNHPAYYYLDDVSVTLDTISGDGIQNFYNAYSFALYPNPNDGTMQFDYSLAQGSTGEFVIYSLSGVRVAEYKLIEGDKNTLKISETGLKDGIYFYSEIVNETVITNGKLIIIR